MHKSMPITIQNQSKKNGGQQEMGLGDKLKKRAGYLRETVRIYTTLMGILLIIVLTILWYVVGVVTDLFQGIKKLVKNRSKYDTNK